jgi:isopenicillin-N epimerase
MHAPQVPGATARFGRKMLEHWQLDPEITYLNHGTVGATPRRVLRAQQAIRDEIERNPSRFLLRELSGVVVGVPRSERPRMRVAADQVAAFVGAKGEDLAFVDNVTTGCNAILQSLELRAGDEIVVLSHAYDAIVNAAGCAAGRAGARVVTAEIPYPTSDPGSIVRAIDQALGPRTRLAVVDHITSESAVILPLAGIAEHCRKRGVPILADGAHGPGAIPLDLASLGVDWYAANLHKWAFAPRGCGFLWAAPGRGAGIHPPVISWGVQEGFPGEFDWLGTRDPSPWLAAPEGVAFLNDLGADAVLGHNHSLAWEGGQRLCRQWGARIEIPESMVGSMVTVPLPDRLGSTPEDAARLRDALLFEDRIEVQVHAWKGRLWTRVSAQVYNEMDDIERLATAVGAKA